MPSSDHIFRMFVRGKMAPFYERYYPGMITYASRLLGDQLAWMADDCVQDAVLDAFQKRASFGTADQWRAHILTCIHHRAVSALRRLTALRNYTERHDASVIEDDATRALIEHETLDALYGAIRDLPPEYRTILSLSFEEGLKNAEIAARLGVAEITVKKRKARMLAMLRDMLGDTLGRDIDIMSVAILLTLSITRVQLA
ncbi:MAG: sigma-70 family RNA polymerase sigma factor [Duncaniella sp.]|nr:sigma-70 family RNA polymerase sigma factor [Duncaniella sp.]